MEPSAAQCILVVIAVFLFSFIVIWGIHWPAERREQRRHARMVSSRLEVVKATPCLCGGTAGWTVAFRCGAEELTEDFTAGQIDVVHDVPAGETPWMRLRHVGDMCCVTDICLPLYHAALHLV
ncbi:MAG: hypothetical protein PHT12_03725 [Patescibacteria group bacterium]|nr:hypothetical protein [Patescibacteria group bacterium]